MKVLGALDNMVFIFKSWKRFLRFKLILCFRDNLIEVFFLFIFLMCNILFVNKNVYVEKLFVNFIYVFWMGKMFVW